MQLLKVLVLLRPVLPPPLKVLLPQRVLLPLLLIKLVLLHRVRLVLLRVLPRVLQRVRVLRGKTLQHKPAPLLLPPPVRPRALLLRLLRPVLLPPMLRTQLQHRLALLLAMPLVKLLRKEVPLRVLPHQLPCQRVPL